MRIPYLRPELACLEIEEETVLCASGTNESFGEAGDFEGFGDWE